MPFVPVVMPHEAQDAQPDLRRPGEEAVEGRPRRNGRRLGAGPTRAFWEQILGACPLPLGKDDCRSQRARWLQLFGLSFSPPLNDGPEAAQKSPEPTLAVSLDQGCFEALGGRVGLVELRHSRLSDFQADY